MFVQGDESRNYRVAAEIEHLSAGRNRDRSLRPDRLDPAAAHDDGLTVTGGGASSIQESHVCEGHDGSVYGDKRLQARTQLRSLLR